jgi:hypothetical protein
VLDSREAVVSRRPTNRIWADEDIERLRLHIESGGSVGRAAVIFKRSATALRTEAGKHGWKFPTIRQLRARAVGSSESRFYVEPYHGSPPVRSAALMK